MVECVGETASMFDGESQLFGVDIKRDYMLCRGGCGMRLPLDQRRHHRGRCPACRRRAANSKAIPTGPSNRTVEAARPLQAGITQDRSLAV